jgi:hypothetical protein
MVISAWKQFSEEGDRIEPIKQGGGTPLPDLIGHDGEHLMKLSGGRKVNFEVECKTTTKPARLLQNLKKAKKCDRPCFFLAEDDIVAEKINKTIKHPFVEKKDGKCEYYMSESGTQFIPEKEFSSPICESDWMTWVQQDGKFIVYKSKNEACGTDDETDSTEMALIENFLKENKGPYRPCEISKILRMKANAVRSYLSRLFDENRILRPQPGRYMHPRWISYNAV